MIRLSVDKFRQWQSGQWDLPETGMVRLAGDSEAGKSSLMYAIAWALWGKAATSNVTTIGAKGTVVNFVGFGLNIERKKNPERLICGASEDTAAQVAIEKALGMNCEQFFASSFVQQKMKGSLLTLSPADQLRFVQKLAFGENDPEQYRTKIFAKMKELETSVEICEAECNMRQSQIQNMRSQLRDVLPMCELESQLSACKVRIDSMRAEIDANTAKIADLDSQLLKLAQERGNPRRQMEKTLQDIERRIFELGSESLSLGDLPESFSVSDELAKWTARRDLCTQQKAWLGVHAKYVKVQSAIGGEVETAEQCLDALGTKLSHGLQEQLECREGIAHCENEIRKVRESKKVLVCPHCTGSVRYMPNGTLSKSDIEFSDIDTMVFEQQIKKYQSVASTLLTTHNTCNDMVRVVKEYMSAGQAPIPQVQTEEQLNGIIQQLQAKHTEATMLGSRIARKADIAKEAELVHRRHGEILSEIARHTPPVELSILDSMEQACQSGKRNLSDSSFQIKTAIAKEQQSIDHINSMMRAASANAAMQANITASEVSLAQSSAQCDVLRSKYGAACHLKQLSDAAATEAVTAMLASINTNVKVYLDLLFPNCGTNIQLQHEKINKTDGKAKAQFSLSIIHNGTTYSSLDELSGGATNRAILAFQLALSDLYNSPVLLLDEPFAGTHPQLRDDCLDALKSIGQKKLLLITDHGASDGWFDHVVYVK
jgi:DNA repair exonuclease SbcCD ATPase subunit